MATETKTAPAANAKPATPDAKEKKAKRALRVPMPTNLQDAVALKAKDAKVTPSIWVRDEIAKLLGIKIEATTGGARKKYATKEERKEASKARRLSRAALVKELLAKHAAEQAAAEKAASTKK